MKALLLPAFLISFSARAQLSPQFAADATRYFSALPYGKDLKEWATELKADTARYELQSSNDKALFDARIRLVNFLPEADSAFVRLGSVGTYLKNRATGERLPGRTYFSLLQQYRVPKDSLSWNGFRKRCMEVVRDLSGNANRKELNLSSEGKLRMFTITDWNHTQPDVVVRFGELRSGPFWYLTMELQYNP
ncbi:MAG: hypothetical protein EOO11_11265 [Chitinophagaceae bacterium]|nr:MAG: hypothetical protein EOO11_11265 [Chitinophagaceae bacterium]